MDKSKKGLIAYFGIVSVFMCFFTFSCELLAKIGDFEWSVIRFLTILALSILWGACISLLTFFFFALKDKIAAKRVTTVEQFRAENRMAAHFPKESKVSGKAFYISWAVLLVFYIPIYLAYFPGNCCYDFLPQVGQILYGPLNDHHPLVHTEILHLFMIIGEKFLGSASAGFGLFCFLQMTFMSWIFSLCIYKTALLTGKRVTLVILTALFALYPFNHYMSISITKDVPFSAGMILAITCLLSMTFTKNAAEKTNDKILLFIAGIMVMLFRNNGRYSWLFFIGICFLVMLFNSGKRKLYFKIMLNAILSFVIGFAILVCVKKVTNAEGGDKREMFSLPAQQIARAVNYKYDELDADFISEVENLIWPESLYAYRPDISDPVKRNVISWEILHRPKNTLDIYMTLLKKYPSEYVNAFLELYAGFLSPLDRSHRFINDNGEGLPTGLHYVQTVFYDEAVEKGFWQKPLSEGLHTFFEWYANNDIYIKVPILSLIFVPGTFLWLYLFLAGICVYLKKSNILVPMSIVLGYYITMFLGPTVQLRYLYPIMICVPIFISFMRHGNESN